MTSLLRPTATATIDATIVNIDEGETKLDVAAVPYATSRVQLPLLSDALLAWLDPRLGTRRVPFTAGVDGVTRSYDLGLRTTSVDHESKKVTLDLASDEALLQDYAPLTTDTGARASQTSARAVCDYVLGTIGASLEAGTDDANVTAYWGVTNLIPNPSFEVNTTGWVAGFGASALTRVATAATGRSGSFAMLWTAGAGAANVHPVANATTLSITPGKWYVWEFSIYSGVAATARATIQWYASNGAVFVGETLGTSFTTSTSTFQRAFVIAQAPAGATHAWPFVGTSGNAGGNGHVVDGAIFYEGTERITYFDGSITPTGYTVAWTGTAHNSPSTRTPIVERLPELFVWKPGTSAWDFVVSIITSAGLVLWCDELRKWRLQKPENRTIVTLVNVDAATSSTGQDTLSRDDRETYVTGVVVRYKWRDEDGIDREQYDSAGTTSKVMLVDIEGAYPGPGAATAILARRQGTGRRQTVTAIVPVGTTPGMTASIKLPAAPNTVGRVASVTFDHKTGFADLGAAGLVDIMPGSIDALVGSIDALVGTIDSL